MPELNSPIHLQMLRDLMGTRDTDDTRIYGLEWGDPDDNPFLGFVRDHYITPYLDPQHVALEIGPGGGRWTRYLLSFRGLYVVDLHAELLAELAKRFQVPHLRPVHNSGCDFPGIPENSIDFVFTFGVFVHLDRPIIEAYLRSLWPIVRPSANIVIQYSDKTKSEARNEPSFADNTPAIMRRMVSAASYTILEENLTRLPHSSIMRFRKARPGERSFAEA